MSEPDVTDRPVPDAGAFDVVVIGAGPAGEVLAGRCAAGGLAVAAVEAELAGGECSYWGCIPSKTLIRPGDVIAAARRVPGAAEAVTGPIDVARALARRDEMTSGWDDEGQVAWLEGAGVRLVRGVGRLAAERVVEVTSGESPPRRLEARRAVVLATGTGPAIPPIPGLAEVEPWDNRSVTSMPQVPGRLLVLGGGTIGVEMAQAVKRLGADAVTVIEGAPTLMAREEPFVGEELRAALEAEGIGVVTGATVSALSRDGRSGDVVATVDDGRTFAGDEILVAVGRVPKTADLGLEVVGLAPGRYVDVDDRCRASGVPGAWLYAVGDCNGRALLTHMGKYQARLAADVILGRDPCTGPDDAGPAVDRDMVPRVTFTDPQVAAVGLTERQARERGVTVRTVRVGLEDTAGASTSGTGVRGSAFVVVDEERRVVVGATFTGPGVQELLHSATVAVVGEVGLDRLWHAVPSFPTLSEVWLRLLEAYGL
ncbi:MAG TPA: NAD(P)/FAD-dependent oxidoreductase [Acidimicrobiales bacterium]|nr:NAD(P)/FAD-dependent oxidoreductase [Acidimicrobiales bacterium]